jgi:hypothetical protein
MAEFLRKRLLDEEGRPVASRQPRGFPAVRVAAEAGGSRGGAAPLEGSPLRAAKPPTQLPER